MASSLDLKRAECWNMHLKIAQHPLTRSFHTSYDSEEGEYRVHVSSPHGDYTAVSIMRKPGDELTDVVHEAHLKMLNLLN